MELTNSEPRNNESANNELQNGKPMSSKLQGNESTNGGQQNNEMSNGEQRGNEPTNAGQQSNEMSNGGQRNSNPTNGRLHNSKPMPPKKRKRILLAGIGLLLALSFLLGATVLPLAAAEEAAVPQGKDRLIGALITTDYLDLFDMEGYLQDHLADLLQNNQVTAEDSEKYQGRLYAARTEVTHTDPETGETFTLPEFQFGDVKGVPFFYYEEEREHGTVTSLVNSSDGKNFFADTVSNFGNDKITLEGTIYFTPSAEETFSCYVNPVYQSPDGSIYAVAGNGYSFSQDSPISEGGLWSTTLSEDTSVYNGEETIAFSTSVKINLSVMYAPASIRLIQMDEENRLLDQKEYVPGQVPDRIAPDPKAAYLLLETVKQDPQGGEIVSREMFQPKDSGFTSFYSQGDGPCLSQYTELAWPER